MAHIEQVSRDAGLDPMIQMSVAVADGNDLCGVRYATHGEPRTLYHSTDLETVRKMYPTVENFQRLDDTAHLLVSEPLSALPGVWNLVPAGSFVRFSGGREQIEPFTPAVATTA